MKKLSPEEQDYCVERVRFWQKILGIFGWQIFIIFGKCDGNSRAEVEFNRPGKAATITFSREFDTSWDKSDLDKTAFHEVCEVKYEAFRNFLADDLCDSLIHDLIRLDENTLHRLLSEYTT
jgi:hypothetical protein